MKDMYERQQAEARQEEEYWRQQYENRRETAEEYRERMKREGRDDPFNTPFENWYHEQRQDPFSEVSMMQKYLRFFLWSCLFLFTLKMLGFIRRRDPHRDAMNANEAYFRQAEMERM